MKRKIGNLLVIILAAATFAACGNTTAATKTETQTESTTSSRAQELAQEYVSRHITPEDEISVEIIEALIQEIKAAYPFEEGVDEIKLAKGDNQYIGQGKG